MPDTKVPDWPIRPFDPTCMERVPRDQETMQAIQRVYPDWDGENWYVLGTALLDDNVSEARLKELTVHNIRSHFAARQKVIILKHGGQPHTTDATIIPTIDGEYGVVTVTPGTSPHKNKEWAR